MRGMNQRVRAALIITGIIAVLAGIAQKSKLLQVLVDQEAQLRNYVHSSPLFAWCIGLAIYTCLSVIPGTSGKAVIAGWLYGFWPALLLADLALTAAALITFEVSRVFLRESVEARFGMHVVLFRKKLEAGSWFYLIMLRLIHTPFSLVNCFSGATDIVSIRTFWWTTQIGLLPGTAVFVLAGTRIPSLSSLVKNGPLSILDPVLVMALVTASLLSVLLPLAVRPFLSATNRDSKISVVNDTNLMEE